MKLKILNQILTIEQSSRFIPHPYYDLNYSSDLILVSNHIPLKGEGYTDKDLLNYVILKASIDILSNKLGGVNSKTNVVLDWLISKIDIVDDIYTIDNGKKEKVY